MDKIGRGGGLESSFIPPIITDEIGRGGVLESSFIPPITMDKIGRGGALESSFILPITIDKIGRGGAGFVSLGKLRKACNHAGLLDRAVENFNKMMMDYDLSFTMDQYACLIDLYARQGHIRKAMQLMDEMPFDLNSVILSSPQDSIAYLTMAHIYAEAGFWDEAANIRKLMKPKGLEKCGAWSWVEVDEQLSYS
uniref:Pentatricopeptide repeat-containing protein n=1 Tax=Chenopodium quinoa TaxID=63459 RepID=A0A803MRW4_CHEQI